MAVRSRTLALLVAVASLLAIPSAGQAAITSTHVAAPADNTRIASDTSVGAAANPVTFSGTSNANNASDKVDVGCWHQNATDDDFARFGVIATSVDTDDVTGDWSISVNMSTRELGDRCLVRAVPAGSFSIAAGTIAQFTGPTMTFASMTTTKVSSGPNTGKISNWFLASGQSDAAIQVYSPNACGLCDTQLRIGATTRDTDNGTTFDGALWGDSGEAQIKGYGGLTVDGAFAYTPDAIESKSVGGVFGRELAGFEGITVSATPGLTGVLTVTETMQLVKCSAAADQPEPGNACVSLVRTGVSLTRTWTIDATGREARMVDTYTSTDGAAHAVRGQYWSGYSSTGHYEASWINSGTPFATPMGGAAVALPPSAPWSMVKNSNTAGGDAYAGRVYTGEVMSVAPSNLHHSGDYADYLLATTALSVPAGGSVKLERSSLVSASKADVIAFNARETDRMGKPTVAITAPATGSLLSAAPIVVSGTATDNVGIASLTVNGVVTPVAAGAFSTAITPAVGANTVTVVAKDAAGNEVSATTTFSFLQKTFTGTKKNDKLTGNSGANVLNGLAGNDTIDCGAGGKDVANGGAGNDKITCVEPLATAKANADTVNCGPGKGDVAVVDPFDKVVGCEKVTRVWIGSAKADKAKGTKANDRFDLKGGNDSASCGGGNDVVALGAGNDVVNCVDKGKGAKKSKDIVNCGPGKKDKAVVDRFDKVTGCEKVTRV